MKIWVAAAIVCASSLPYGSQAFVQSHIANFKPLLKISPRTVATQMQMDHEVASRRSFFEKSGASAAVILAEYLASPSKVLADTCSRKDCQPQVVKLFDRAGNVLISMFVCPVPESMVFRRLTFCRRVQLRKRRTSPQCRPWRAR